MINLTKMDELMDTMDKTMKEIRFSKIYCSALLIFHGFILVLCCFLTVYFLYSLTIVRDIRAILFGSFMSIVFLLTARPALTDVVFSVRFYCLRVKADGINLADQNYWTPKTIREKAAMYCLMIYMWNL